MSSDTVLQWLVDQIQLDASQPLKTAIKRFSGIPPTPDTSFISVSSQIPGLFTSLETVDSSYLTLLTLPTPTPAQLSSIRTLLPEKSSADSSSSLSLCLAYAESQTFIPVWMVQVWPRLYALKQLCLNWTQLIPILCSHADAPGPTQAPACELLDRVSAFALDSPVSNQALRHFRTSHLPVLIQNFWLSDEHLNAGVEYINWHPNRLPAVLALSSFHVDFLRNNFRRSTTYPASRLTSIDRRIMSQSITELLVPIHLPMHWVSLYINISLRTYAYTDTLDLLKLSAPYNVLGLFNRWLTSLLGSPVNLMPSPRPFSIGAQSDSHSCGVAVLSSIAHYSLQGLCADWTQSSAQEHRFAWALRLTSCPSDLDASVTESLYEDSGYQSSALLSPVASHKDLYSYLSDDTTTPFSDALSPNSASSDSIAGPPKATMRQTTLTFKPIPYKDYVAQETLRYRDWLVEREDKQTHREHQAKLREAERREYERDRKRVQRARQREAKQAIHDARKVQIDAQQDQTTNEPLVSQLKSRQVVSALSRPYSTTNATVARLSADSIQPSKRRRLNTIKQTHRINWAHPAYWSVIDKAAHTVGYPWAPTDIVRRLQLLDPETYQHLRPQRISQWRDHNFPDELRWTTAHLANIKAGTRPVSGTGRQSILHNRPDVKEAIKKCLTDLRTAGISLDLNLIRGYMVGVIAYMIPNAPSFVTWTGQEFSCSIRFVRRFLSEELNWSVRRATRAAQKYPPNVNTILLHAFLRMACAIRDYSIPESCIINADQTQIVYSSGDQKTWNPIGERQVSILGVEDKRAFTLLVSVSMSGSLLPFQAIYTGKTLRSVPDSSSAAWSEAQQLGILLEPSMTQNYWSTYKTMCNWVDQIVAPYYEAEKKRLGLPADQRCLLQIDCWALHRSAELRNWLESKYPWIILHYVPGGCTGLFQACDVGIQRVLKLAIRDAIHADVVKETIGALQSGIEPQYVVNDRSLPTLRRRSLGWIVRGYNAVRRPELVKKAFRLCAVPDSTFNLSYESLTSAAARQALVQLSMSNPTLYREFALSTTLPSTEYFDEDQTDRPGEDDESSPTVEDVCRVILGANSAQDAAGPVSVEENESDGEKQEVGSVFASARTAPGTSRATKRPRGRATKQGRGAKVQK